MDYSSILMTFATTALPIGGFLAWMWSRLDKKFEKIDERFIAMDKKIDERLEKIENRLAGIEGRLSRLEGQDEERFRNEIRLIAKSKES